LPLKKLRNAFSEVFLVQIWEKIQKIRSKNFCQSKKYFRKHVPKYFLRGKLENLGIEKIYKGWKKNFSLKPKTFLFGFAGLRHIGQPVLKVLFNPFYL
jgi:hypothetical protein